MFYIIIAIIGIANTKERRDGMKECKKCGYENDNNVRYCSKCGMKFVVEAEAISEDVNNEPQEPAQEPIKNDINDIDTMNLAELVQEYRRHNRELVETKNWYKSCIMMVLPLVGLGYFFFAKDKNENISNFNKAARVISIAYNVCLIALVAFLLLSSSQTAAYQEQTQAQVESQSQSQSVKQTESQTQTESQLYLTPVKQTEVETTKITTKLSSDKGFVWDKNEKTFDFMLNGVNYRIPTSNPTDYKQNGWRYIATTLNPLDTTESFIHFDLSDKTDLKVYFKNEDEKMQTTRLYLLLPEKTTTTFFGLKTDSSYEDVKKVFADGIIVTDTYKTAEKYGEIKFKYDAYVIRVGIKDAYIRFLYIEKEN